MNTIETNIGIFKKWVKYNAPSMYGLLRDGASDQELQALELHIGAKLPESFNNTPVIFIHKNDVENRCR